MRHVGRFDHETGLLITEVTQAEFDALPTMCPAGMRPGDMWTRTRGRGFDLRYCWQDDDELRISVRYPVIVDQSEPTSSSTSVSPASGSAAAT